MASTRINRGLALLLAPLLGIALAGCPDDIYFTDNYETYVVVQDQTPDGDGDITIEWVYPYIGGWVAIHRDDNGAPSRRSRPIGGAQLEYDRSDNFKLRLDSAVAPGERLWAVIHNDYGTYGRFEYDGVDTTDNMVYDYYEMRDSWDDFIIR